MGNQQVSRFSSQEDWKVLSKKEFKEVLQSVKTKQIVERHTLQHVDPEEMKQEELIFQWRNHKKTSKFTAQIKQMKHIKQQPSQCFSVCHRPGQTSPKLVVYTQQIHKLYQNNTSLTFNHQDQMQLFCQLVEAIDILAKKFGYFMVSKQMIGFNQQKTGKAWINQNLASNFVQYKRQVDQRQKWQKSIIQAIIDICELCTIEARSKDHRFSFIISQIRKNKLVSFQKIFNCFKKSRNESIIMLYKSQQKDRRLGSEQKSHHKVISNQYSNSKQGKVKSNNLEFIYSTKDCKNKRMIKQKKVVMVPVVNIKKISPVSEEERLIIESHFRSSDHLSNYRPNSFINSRQNYVQVQKHTYSYITENDGQGYRHVLSQINKPLDSIVEHNYLGVNHRRDSSISSLPQQEILLVDSMIVVENQFENQQSFQKNTKIILDESIILRGHQKQ